MDYKRHCILATYNYAIIVDQRPSKLHKICTFAFKMFLDFYQVTYDDTVLVTESDKEFFDISDTSDDSEIDGDFNEQVSFYTVIS